MDGFLTRLYQTYRGRYTVGLLVGLYVWVIVVVVIGAFLTGRYVAYDLAQTALVACAFILTASIPVAWTTWAQRDGIRTLSAWANGSAQGEEAVERTRLTMFGFSQRFAAGCVWRLLLFIPITAGVVTGISETPFAWDTASIAAVASLFVILYGALVAAFLSDLVLRPLRQEVGVGMDGREFKRFRSYSVMTRLIAGLGCSSMVLGFFVATLVLPSGAGAGAEGRAIAITIAVVLSLGLSLAFPLTRNALDPVKDLIIGTRWISQGGLGWRVPVTSTDELGELAASFNEMASALQAHSEELRASQARIVASSDEARRKVERDLHDGAQQHLVLLDLKLALAQKAVEGDTKAASALDEARADLERALVELRDLAHGIYPSVLTNDGLPAALDEAVARAGITTSVEASGAGRYSPELEAAVYFCCNEALQNAGKYAGGGAKAAVRLSAANGELRFQVSDDGLGFDVASTNGSAGLQNMADRIGALGGEVTVASTPGEGTTVAGSVPLRMPTRSDSSRS